MKQADKRIDEDVQQLFGDAADKEGNVFVVPRHALYVHVDLHLDHAVLRQVDISNSSNRHTVVHICALAIELHSHEVGTLQDVVSLVMNDVFAAQTSVEVLVRCLDRLELEVEEASCRKSLIVVEKQELIAYFHLDEVVLHIEAFVVGVLNVSSEDYLLKVTSVLAKAVSLKESAFFDSFEILSLLCPLILVLRHLLMVNGSVVVMHPGDQLIETFNPLLLSLKLSLSQRNLCPQRKLPTIVIHINGDDQASLITDLQILVGDQFNKEIINLFEDEEVKLFLQNIIGQLDLIDESLGEVSDVEDD